MNFTSSFFENIKDKTTNPFFGTLIFVWLVRNWDLVYTIFNFDSDCNLEDKKIFIRNYYVDKIVWQEIGLNILIAFGLMVLSYGLIVVSRLVVNVTNHNIIPRMNEKTVSKLVVNKNRFETVKKTRDEYFIKIQDFEEQVIVLEQKNSLLKKTNIEQESKIKENKKTLSEVNKELTLSAKKNNEDDEEILKSNIKINDINAKINDVTSDYNELVGIIIKYINELDIYTFESYNQVNIPKEIKEAYLMLNGDSVGNKYGTQSKVKLFNQLTDVDKRFFDIAEQLKMNIEVNFKEIYIKYLITIGLIEIKQDYKENIEMTIYTPNTIKLTILGKLVSATEDIYLALKKNEVLN